MLYSLEIVDKSQSSCSHLECFLACLHLDSKEHREEIVIIIFYIDQREKRAKN